MTSEFEEKIKQKVHTAHWIRANPYTAFSPADKPPWVPLVEVLAVFAEYQQEQNKRIEQLIKRTQTLGSLVQKYKTDTQKCTKDLREQNKKLTELQDDIINRINFLTQKKRSLATKDLELLILTVRIKFQELLGKSQA